MFDWFSKIAGKNGSSDNPELAKEYLQQAQKLFDEGRFEPAILQFESALKHDAKLIEAWLGLSKALFKLGRVQDAKNAAVQGLAANPESARLNFLMGTLCLHGRELPASTTYLQKAVALDPADAGAHSNLGVVHQLQGDQALAAACFRTAAEINPQLSDARFNLGTALQALGKIDDAIGSYRQTISIAPGRADAHNNLGCLLLAQGKDAEAVGCFLQAVAIKPDYAEAYFNLGNAQRDQNRLAEAGDSFRKALALRPGYGSATINLGVVLQAEGRFTEAIDLYREALAASPKNADLYCNLGIALTGAKRVEEAIDSYRNALSHNPRHLQTLINLGAALQSRNQLDDAIALYRQALTIDAQSADAYYNLGRACLSKGMNGEAAESYEAALKINPGYPDGWTNLGVALHEQNKIAEAIACYKKAIAAKPAEVAAQVNLGLALQDSHNFELSMAAYDRALEIDSTSAEAHCFRGLLRLLLGDFSGWEGYEYRFKLRQPTSPPRTFSFPRWHRHLDLRGKSILLHAEQGMGDTLQFVRYVGHVKALGAEVHLEVQRPLRMLLADYPGVTAVFSLGDALPAMDFHCPLGSLPFEFKTDLSSIPVNAPCFKSRPDRVQRWKERLEKHDAKLRVGVVWSGNGQHKNDRNRSIPLKVLAPLFDEPIHFYSLQKEVRPADAPVFAQLAGVTDLAPDLRDFVDTAEVVSHLDLVISVDTSVAHLAGSLGKPVWILLPYNSDFRWLDGRVDSPWYPSARLFRQPDLGDWDSVIATLRRALMETQGTV
jgi:tetratricopeptide (TPR) repeat protein